MDRLILGMSLLLGTGEVNNRVVDELVVDDCLEALLPKDCWYARCSNEWMRNQKSTAEAFLYVADEYRRKVIRPELKERMAVWNHRERLWLSSQGRDGTPPWFWTKVRLLRWAREVEDRIPRLVTMSMQKY